MSDTLLFILENGIPNKCIVLEWVATRPCETSKSCDESCTAQCKLLLFHAKAFMIGLHSFETLTSTQ